MTVVRRLRVRAGDADERARRACRAGARGIAAPRQRRAGVHRQRIGDDRDVAVARIGRIADCRGDGRRQGHLGERHADRQAPGRNAEGQGLLVESRGRGDGHGSVGMDARATADRSFDGRINIDEREVDVGGADAGGDRVGFDVRGDGRRRRHGQRSDRRNIAEHRVRVDLGAGAAADGQAGERRADAERADARLPGQLGEIARRVGRNADIVGRTDAAEARLREAGVVDDDRAGPQPDETGGKVERDDVNVLVQNRADRDVATRRVRAVVSRGDVVRDRQDVDRAAGAHHAGGNLAQRFGDMDRLVCLDADVSVIHLECLVLAAASRAQGDRVQIAVCVAGAVVELEQAAAHVRDVIRLPAAQPADVAAARAVVIDHLVAGVQPARRAELDGVVGSAARGSVHVRRTEFGGARNDVRTGMDDGGGARRHGRAVLKVADCRLRRRVSVDSAIRGLRAGIYAVGVGVGVAAAVVAEVAQPLGNHPSAGLRLLGGIAVGIAVVVVDAVGAVAAVVTVCLVQRRADRPHAHRGAGADETAGAADRVARQVLQSDRVDPDVVPRRNRRAGLDLGIDVVVEGTDIDCAGHADEAPRDADHEGLDADVVGRVDVDALRAVGVRCVVAIDHRAAFDRRARFRADQGDADRARDADEPDAAGSHDVHDVFARLRLHDHAVGSDRLEIRAAGNVAVEDAGHPAAAAQRVDVGVADRRRGVLADQHHADRAADAHESARQRAGELEHLGVVGRRDEHVAAGVHRRVVADARRGVVADAEHVDHRPDADRAGGDAHPHHYDVFLARRLDRDVVQRIDRRAVADPRASRIADDVDADRWRDAHGADAHPNADRQVVEVVARPDQDGLGGTRARGAPVDRRVGADVGLGIGIDDVDPGRNADADRARAETDGESPDLVAVRRGHGHPVEAGLAVEAGGAREGAGDRAASAVALQVHAAQIRRVHLPGGLERVAIAARRAGHGGATARFDALAARVVGVK